MDAVALGEGAARALPSLERGAVQHAQVASTAARNPKTTVTERGANRSSGTHHRSAITGKFVKGSTAARHPNTTVTERG